MSELKKIEAEIEYQLKALVECKAKLLDYQRKLGSAQLISSGGLFIEAVIQACSEKIENAQKEIITRESYIDELYSARDIVRNGDKQSNAIQEWLEQRPYI